ncbi:uncharacterized protein LOC124626276 [Ictalurus punctatus]|uniref:Uncharacterized protein LOC124626276 n=1 Tax=Ictalurus punctatus TaxID=7998 RepID=A0A979ELJ6_ICTPU|nr:uncharacterized protein LOC124626276 [Ictalurus punctatus]
MASYFYWVDDRLSSQPTRSKYFSLFLSKAYSILASHGTVSLMRSMVLVPLDHITVSGRRLVLVISLRNWSFLPRSSLILQFWVKGTILEGILGVVLVLPHLLSQIGSADILVEDDLCLWPVYAPPTPRPICSGLDRVTTCSTLGRAQSCSLKKCAGDVHLDCYSGGSTLPGQTTGARKCVVCCPEKKTKPCLRDFPQVCHADVFANSAFPHCPVPWLSLCYCLDLIVLILNQSPQTLPAPSSLSCWPWTRPAELLPTQDESFLSGLCRGSLFCSLQIGSSTSAWAFHLRPVWILTFVLCLVSGLPHPHTSLVFSCL